MIEVGDLVQLTGKGWNKDHFKQYYNEMVIVLSIHDEYCNFRAADGEAYNIFKIDGVSDFSATIVSKAKNEI